MIGDVRDGWRVVDRVDGHIERVGREASVGIRHLHGDRRGARGVRRRRDGHCAIRSHTAEHNVAVRDQAGIAAGAGDGQAGGGRFGVAHDEGQGGRRSVFVDHLVRDVGDRRKIVHTVHVQSERIGRGRSVRIRYLDRDIRAAGGIRSGCHRDGSIRSATSQHDVGDRDDRNVAGGNVECQAAGRCFQIADRERDRAGRLIFVRQLVGNIGDRWRIVDRRHDQIERFDCGGVVGIGHRDRDGRGAERVGDRRQRDRAVGAAAAERDARVGDNCLIAGNGRQCQAVGRRFEIANRERNRAGRRVFLRQLVADVGDGRRSVRQEHIQVERVGCDVSVAVHHIHGDHCRTKVAGSAQEVNRAIGSAAAERNVRVRDETRIAR